jgi:hypothetical protein
MGLTPSAFHSVLRLAQMQMFAQTRQPLSGHEPTTLVTTHRYSNSGRHLSGAIHPRLSDGQKKSWSEQS